MFFKRESLQAAIRASIAESPVTLLVAGAGTGKSRLIDSLFEFEGDYDTRHVAFIRIDERVNDLDSLAHCFARGFDRRYLPDDIEYHQAIIDEIRGLSPNHLIIVDNLHVLNGNVELVSFVHRIINESGLYDEVPSRRWLLASRDLNDFPHSRWLPDRKYRLISDEIVLQPDEIRSFESLLKIPLNTLSGKTPRHLMAGYAALRALRSLPEFSHEKRKVKADRKKYGRQAVAAHALLSPLQGDISSGIIACSFAYDLNPDLLIDHIPNIDKVIQVLTSLDLAYFDLSANHIQIDADFRDGLQELLLGSSDAIVYTAVKIACELHCDGAFLERALMTLVKLERWDMLMLFLEEYGIDLVDRYRSQRIISDVIVKFQKM